LQLAVGPDPIKHAILFSSPPSSNSQHEAFIALDIFALNSVIAAMIALFYEGDFFGGAASALAALITRAASAGTTGRTFLPSPLS
jgi:hypothetical protein